MQEKMQEPAFSTASFATAGAAAPTARTARRVTAAATSAKFVLLGLSDGTLALYDAFGHALDEHVAAHAAAVTAAALGAGAGRDDVVASAAADGSVRAARLFAGAGAAAAQSAMLRGAAVAVERRVPSAVVAVAVDPSFGKPRFGERVAWAEGDGRVVLFTAGWFGGSEVVLTEAGLGGVCTVAWLEVLLAVATVREVRVFDTRFNRAVCVVAAPGALPSPGVSGTAGDAAEEGEASGEREGTSGETVGAPTSTLAETPVRGSDATPAEPDEGKADETDATRRTAATEPVAPQPDARLYAPKQWANRTKVYMETDATGALSPHGEPPVRLYVTWPSGGRIVHIGPHRDNIAGDDTPPRQIDVRFRLQRAALPSADLTAAATQPDADVSEFPSSVNDESPLLALVPFGAQLIALVGTPGHGVTVHLVDAASGVSVKHMRLQHEELVDADLVTVPGGDPLVLVVGHTSFSHLTGACDDERDVAANQEVTFVRSLTIAERVKWLLGQNRFSDALQIAQSAPGGSLRRAEVSIEDIGEQFLDSLEASGNYARLAAVLPETIRTTSPSAGFRGREKVMTKRTRRWERWIEAFRKADKLAIVAPVIPTYEPCLSEKMYNGILVELAGSDAVVMLDVLKTWPADVFGVSAVTQAIEGHLAADADVGGSRETREPLREGLLMMYGLSGRHDETLNLLLREQSPKVYDYIRSHHLYEAVRSPETITGLYRIDAEAATEILSHAPDTVLPPEAVVPILGKVDNSEWTFMYLHAMFRMDADYAPKYHNLLLKLYVKHGAPGMLSTFLTTSTHYSLDRALQELGGPRGGNTGTLAKERVYVLSAMGDLNGAMSILLDELGDTFAAIEFASDHADGALWERLIEHAGSHAETLAALLDSPAGGKVDAVRLVPLLGSRMRIPRLRERLHRILVDAALERALREDAAAALHHDASELLARLDEAVSVLET